MAASNPAGEAEGETTRFSFARQEEEILAFWKKIDAFGNCLKQSKDRPTYTFYDGPPFATGLPHYGHLLTGTIKDIVTRYAHQKGYHVERRAGWDTHGLPVEYEIDKKLGIKSKDEVYAMGVDKYNEECRAIVMRYSSEWVDTVTRLGRWIDFDNDYKTLYPWFMESIWWVFKQIFDKGMVYRGRKVMPFSTGCHTPLSNFEAGQNYVDDVKDPAVVVSFPLVDEPDVALVAWTTTPWTLPSNLALCVHPDFTYVKIKETATEKLYIILEERLSQLYGNNKKSKTKYTIVEKFKGATLKGKQYKPLFPFYNDITTAFRVCNDTYVTATGGTGIVHQAPAFGEDDYRVCLAHGIVKKDGDLPCAIDDDGKFTDPITDFKGQYIKDADKEIMKALKQLGRLVQQGEIMHRYPYCWRSDTPLIYRAVPSWYIKVEEMRPKLCANNDETYWVPNYVKEGRFNNWLMNARDWAFSRSRFWGTPIPIWTNKDFTEIVCIGSIAELEERSGRKVDDLHRHFVDDITIPSEKGGEPLRRVEEVFECWFESWSMPYASRHFPFENKAKFENGFPADFVAEGIDQTRGWFYTLMVISTILFDKPAFKNLVVNGLVLAADGKKMSKRLKNYPDPKKLLDVYGADALRLYMIDSPVVRGEDLRFREDGVNNIVKSVFLPWYNANKFFLQNAQKFEMDTGTKFVFDLDKSGTSDNVTDRWIYNYTQDLLQFVNEEMTAYRLYTVVPRLVQFVEQLTNWYVRLNRKRMKGVNGVDDCRNALNTLFEVLYTLAKAMAPFTPFLSEALYQQLKVFLLKPEGDHNESVHYLMFPEPRAEPDTGIISAFKNLQGVIEAGRVVRDRVTLPIKMPLRELCVLTDDDAVRKDIEMLEEYVVLELNVHKVTFRSIEAGGEFGCVYKCTPNERALGARLKKDRGPVMKELKVLSQESMRSFKATGEMTILGHVLTATDVELDLIMSTTDSTDARMAFGTTAISGLFVLLDTTVDEQLQGEKLVRELVNRVQRLRWKANLDASQSINVFYSVDKDDNTVKLSDVVKKHESALVEALNLKPTPFDAPAVASRKFIIDEVCAIENAMIKLTLTHPLG